ncbi:MAG TPA: YihY/virulence factor BrkB family protein [Deltaproteobacteria bacterium]|nr:YihY/virulence factor BrkB family protein [Deltaproteobacteria bacterium]
MLSTAFREDRCMTYASALAFSSMFSMVPFLIIIFSVLKALDLQSTLSPAVLSNLSVGSSEIVATLLRYIANAKFSSLGIIGLMTIFLSVMLTLASVEDAFNMIWGLDSGKAYHHKFRDYLIVILGIPLMIALAASITTLLQDQAVVQWFLDLPMLGRTMFTLFALMPYLSVWIAMFGLYKFIPNVRVKTENALIGAVLAGTFLQLVQWAFIHCQILIGRTHVIYGALSLLPFFMLWVFTGWMIVLAGMELVCHLQGGKVTLETSE